MLTGGHRKMSQEMAGERQLPSGGLTAILQLLSACPECTR